LERELEKSKLSEKQKESIYSLPVSTEDSEEESLGMRASERSSPRYEEGGYASTERNTIGEYERQEDPEEKVREELSRLGSKSASNVSLENDGGNIEPEDTASFDSIYQPVKVLGKGGYGESYLVIDVNENEYVAKIARYYKREKSENFLLNEGLVLQYMSAKCGVYISKYVKWGVLQFDKAQQRSLIMKYIRGQTIDKYKGYYKQEENKPILRTWIRKLLEGLQCMFNNGVVHRDIKPDNIMVGVIDDERVGSGDSVSPYYIDFGLSCLDKSKEEEFKNTIATQYDVEDAGDLSSIVCREKSVAGTKRYMAPELLITEGPFSFEDRMKSDVYSLGAVLYELITGRTFLSTKKTDYDLRQFHSMIAAKIKKDYDGDASIPPDVYEDTDDKEYMLYYEINQMLDNNPQNRPFPSEVLQSYFAY